PRARLNIAVQEQGGAPVEGAWISVISPADGRILTVAVTDAMGEGRVDLEPRGYRLVARVPGQGREASRDVDVASSGAQEVTLTLPAQ
ncbi:MAG: carboxypeptidase regulatory-like domain-containing protein, partial [Myxococcaceae bacterium]|nr:carboxypeptidase regulatory-like domain-containing protein [Myxococcaceae bacterium]